MLAELIDTGTTDISLDPYRISRFSNTRNESGMTEGNPYLPTREERYAGRASAGPGLLWYPHCVRLKIFRLLKRRSLTILS